MNTNPTRTHDVDRHAAALIHDPPHAETTNSDDITPRPGVHAVWQRDRLTSGAALVTALAGLVSAATPLVIRLL